MYIAQKKEEWAAIASEQNKVDTIMKQFKLSAEKKNILLAIAKAHAIRTHLRHLEYQNEYEKARDDAFKLISDLNLNIDEQKNIYRAIYEIIKGQDPYKLVTKQDPLDGDSQKLKDAVHLYFGYTISFPLINK